MLKRAIPVTLVLTLAGTASAHARLTDPQIFGVANTANLGEIAEAQAVVDRVHAPAVRFFARKMIIDHTGLDDSLSLTLEYLGLSTADSRLEQELRAHSQQEIAEFASTPDSQIDCVYMRSQVEDHAMVLEIIDGVLLPSARNPILRGDLEVARTVVAVHLKLSQMIYESLSCGP